ncbi:hypothetical protein [Dyella silvatica]|uniref:hypothetical protein n=1 Tax=Dyella silvatica TaxID=2992128 RepID=UPI00225A4750|nr:hypothetical protein [Dyella silvatica]
MRRPLRLAHHALAKPLLFARQVVASRLLWPSLIVCLGTACSPSADTASSGPSPTASVAAPVEDSQVWTPTGLCADRDRIEISGHTVAVSLKGQRYEFSKLNRSKPDLIQVTDNHRDDRLAFVLATGRDDSDGVLYFNAGTGNGGAEVRELVGMQFNRCDSTPVNPQQASSAPPQPTGVVLHQGDVYANDGLQLQLRPGVWRPLDGNRSSKLSMLDKGERFEFSIVDEKGAPTVVVIDTSKVYVFFKSAADVLDGKSTEDHYYLFDQASKSLVDLVTVVDSASRPVIKLDYAKGVYHFNMSGTTRGPAEKTESAFTRDLQFSFGRHGDLKIVGNSDDDEQPEKVDPLNKPVPDDRVVQVSPCDRAGAPATYVTVDKDTPFKVAKAHGVDVNLLSRLNPSSNGGWPVGTVLALPMPGAGAPLSELRVQLNDLAGQHQSFAALKVHAGACEREVTTDANGMTPTMLIGGINEALSFEYRLPDGSYVSAEGANGKVAPIGNWSVDLSSRVMQLQPMAGDEPYRAGEASPFPFCPGCTPDGLAKDPALAAGLAGQKFVLPRFNDLLGKDAKAWVYRRGDAGLEWSGSIRDPRMTALLNTATTDRYKVFVGFDGWSAAFDEIKDESDAATGDPNDAEAE